MRIFLFAGVVMVGAVSIAGCGASSPEALTSANEAAPQPVSTRVSAMPVWSVLVGVSLTTPDPDATAERIADSYGGVIVGRIREVREYQMEFPVMTAEQARQLRDVIAQDPDVVLSL